ncbi:threonine--tRNA ligase [Candidatus Gracilibacteria bacterium]|nr:threonine--tRNA ligase [Candidatus Gracilibacteria bacterium]NUJ99349.1 threonine--tRNA ligase [Candidatus Gracilibacteria bacterium]
MNIEIKRHSLAHILAQAVKEIYPNVKIAIGPSIENGFYYDFDFGGEEFKEENLKEVEKRMKKIIQQNQDFRKFEVDYDLAKKILTAMGEEFKIDIIDKIQNNDFKNKEKISGKITFYLNVAKGKSENYLHIQENLKKGIEGKSVYSFDEMDGDQVKNLKFIDMCTGPHVENTREIDANSFKLTKLAGAYWMGDSKNKMLTRIYGLAFDTREELDAYVKQMEEAKKRDHRVLGASMEIFMIDEEVGAGLPLYLPYGAKLRQILEQYMIQEAEKAGYQYVYTPHIAKSDLFSHSGHLDHYKDGMYAPMKMMNLNGEGVIDGQVDEFYLKPMNCPMHHKIYLHKPRSYKELPYKLMEYGTVYRYEESGVLSGLIRVRGFTQNDAHVYCMRSQLFEVISEALSRFIRAYEVLGIKDYKIRFSLPDFENNKEKYGEETVEWRDAIRAMKEVLDKIGVEYYEAPNEAAFYGPKIDIQVRNVNGKEDSLSTIQVDYSIAPKFGITYKNSEGEDEIPAIIHMALMGSIDRFMAFLIEMNGGRFPFWVAPEQIRILTVVDNVAPYVEEIQSVLDETYLMKPYKFNEIRYSIDDKQDSLGKKIRKAEMLKVPMIFVIGEQDMNDKTISIRIKNEETKIKFDELKKYIEDFGNVG